MYDNSWRLGRLLRRALGGDPGARKPSSGELLEASWRLPEPSWRLLESLAGALGVLGAVLEASWGALGRPWSRLRGVLEAPQVVSEPS